MKDSSSKRKQKDESPKKTEAAPAHTGDELASALEQGAEYKDKYLRAMADYQNLERRVQDERQELIPMIRRQIIKEFLPVLANLDTAEKFITDPGLKMIKDQFMQTLGNLGVTEIDVVGKPFDPHTAEAIEAVPGNEDGIVVEVLRKGYQINGKVIQHAQVKVSKKSS
ncbi:MAG: nucleotide exchange factor GrpE [Patescibacteria group bacterium]|nr:nucleotide exchange factor GrpE [Patescibacteria group bacterium]